MRKLKIAQIALPLIRIPPHTYGGTESVVSDLIEGLVERGHEITLFAAGDAKTSAKLVSYFPKSFHYESLEKFFSPLASNLEWMKSLPFLYHVASSLEDSQSFDIIHDHTHYLVALFSSFIKTPIVSTYH